jgi:hypothetical protein
MPLIIVEIPKLAGMEAFAVSLFDFGRVRRFGHIGGGGNLLACAGFAHTRAPFQIRDFPAGEATIMNKPFADAAARPSSTEHGKVPIQAFMTHPATFGFDAQ